MTWSALETVFNVYMGGTALVLLGGLLSCWLAWMGALTALRENQRDVLKISARVVMLCWAWPLILAAFLVIGIWKLAYFLVESADIEELWNRGTK